MRFVSCLFVLVLAGFFVWVGLEEMAVGFDPGSKLFGAIPILIGVGLIALPIVERWTAPRRLLRRLCKHPSTADLFREVYLTIDRGGVTTKSSRGEALLKWHAFQEIVRHGGATLLLTDRNKGIVLPDGPGI